MAGRTAWIGKNSFETGALAVGELGVGFAGNPYYRIEAFYGVSY